MAKIQGELEWADADAFMEFHDWTLASHPARFDAPEFNIAETARSFEIDVGGNKTSHTFAREEEQLTLDVEVDGWTPRNLIVWLRKQLRQDYIHPSDLNKRVTNCIAYLMGAGKIPIAAPMRTKFALVRKLRDCIAAARLEERAKAYQQYLFAPEARVEVSFENGFRFQAGM